MLGKDPGSYQNTGICGKDRHRKISLQPLLSAEHMAREKTVTGGQKAKDRSSPHTYCRSLQCMLQRFGGPLIQDKHLHFAVKQREAEEAITLHNMSFTSCKNQS